jgi:hypothetical protein
LDWTTALGDALPRDYPTFEAAAEYYEAAVHERSKVAERAICDIEVEIAETPAVTMEGALAEARFLLEFVRLYHVNWDGKTSPVNWRCDPLGSVGCSLSLEHSKPEPTVLASTQIGYHPSQL